MVIARPRTALWSRRNLKLKLLYTAVYDKYD